MADVDTLLTLHDAAMASDDRGLALGFSLLKELVETYHDWFCRAVARRERPFDILRGALVALAPLINHAVTKTARINHRETALGFAMRDLRVLIDAMHDKRADDLRGDPPSQAVKPEKDRAHEPGGCSG